MGEGLVERYWAPAPESYAKLTDRIGSLYPFEIEVFELCKTMSGRSVPGYRMGKGLKHVFLLGREHAAP